MKRNSFKKLNIVAVALTVAVTTTSFFAACTPTDASHTSSGITKADVWTTNGSEKICRNVDYEHSDEQSLYINMVKNEKEGAQVILSANEDIEEYTVSVSSLESANGFIPSENISVFHEKYIQLKNKLSNYEGISVGDWVPDAILPWDTAVEYDENKIAKGDNQGVYIEVETSETTMPGTYYGTVTITADSQNQNIPITVKVSDITLPNISRAQNFWMNDMRHHWCFAELDGTDYMAKLYLDTMLEYKMNGALPFNGAMGAEAYAQMIKEYYYKDGFTCYMFYVESKTYEYNGQTCYFDVDCLKEYLKAVVKLSVEDKVNYLDKAIFYMYKIIDEPGTVEAFAKVKSVYSCYDMALKETAKELKLELSGTPNFNYYNNEVYDTLLNIPNILTESESSVHSTLENIYHINNITHCPLTSYFGTEYQRKQYAQYGDSWFYTCCIPLYPEITNHLENDLLGMKIVSWMQNVYNISGYLNWGMAYHRTDSYKEASAEGFIAGDGYMFYPGLDYGIKGLVPSLRAVQYRDGIDDYDLMDALREKYETYGSDASAAITTLFERICTGSIPTTSTEIYYSTRSELIDMITAFNDEFAVVYGETKVESRGQAIVELLPVISESEVIYNGEKLTPDTDGFYKLSIDLTKTSTLVFTVKNEFGERQIEKNLGMKYSLYTDFEDGITSMISVRTESSLSINTQSDYCISGNKSLKINLNGKQVSEGETYTPFISLNSEFVNAVDLTKVSSLELSIYNAADTEVKFSFEGFTGQRYRTFGSVTLKHGWNTVRFDGINKQQEVSKMIALYFLTSNFNIDGGIDLYIDDIYYSVSE